MLVLCGVHAEVGKTKEQLIVTSLTLIFDFADDSRKAQLHHCRAKF